MRLFKVSVIVVISLCLICSASFAEEKKVIYRKLPTKGAVQINKISGPTDIEVGKIYIYSAEIAGSYRNAGWNATGGTVRRDWWKGKTYFCQIQWTANPSENPVELEVWAEDSQGKRQTESLSFSGTSRSTPPEPSGPLQFKKLTGSQNITLGQTYTYSVVVEGSYQQIGWSATGGKVLKDWWQGQQYFCEVQWLESNPDDPIKLKIWGQADNGETTDERLFMTVQAEQPQQPQSRSIGYSSIHIAGGKCLDVDLPTMTNNGAKVQVWDCNNQTQQQWQLDQQGRLVNAGGKCLEVNASEMTTNGGRVQVWDCNNDAQQRWTYNPKTRSLRNAGGKCLDVYAPDLKNNGGRVQVWDCNNEPQQQWTLGEAGSPSSTPKKYRIIQK